MTRNEALIRLYSVFHVSALSADVNLIGLHKILDDLIATEREACAKVAEDGLIGHTIAKAIRARGEA